MRTSEQLELWKNRLKTLASSMTMATYTCLATPLELVLCQSSTARTVLEVGDTFYNSNVNYIYIQIFDVDLPNIVICWYRAS